jgi:hypothetical protein
MVMAGAGVGLTGGPLAIQARFAQGDSRVAAVTGLTLFVCICLPLLSNNLSHALPWIYSSDP